MAILIVNLSLGLSVYFIILFVSFHIFSLVIILNKIYIFIHLEAATGRSTKLTVLIRC